MVMSPTTAPPTTAQPTTPPPTAPPATTPPPTAPPPTTSLPTRNHILMQGDPFTHRFGQRVQFSLPLREEVRLAYM